MYKTTIPVISFLVLTMWYACGGACSCHGPLSEEAIGQIEKEIREYESYVRTQQHDQLDKIFSRDIVFITPSGENIEGFEAVIQSYEGIPALPEYFKTIDEISGVGTLAYTYGTHGTVTGVTGGKYVEIRRKSDDGRWPITKVIWSDASTSPETLSEDE